MNDNAFDRARGAALDRIDRAQSFRRWAMIIACACEVLFLALFVLLADFSDRVHLLLLVAAGLVYMTLGFALLSLWAHVNVATLRVLRGLESLGGGDSRERRG